MSKAKKEEVVPETTGTVTETRNGVAVTDAPAPAGIAATEETVDKAPVEVEVAPAEKIDTKEFYSQMRCILSRDEIVNCAEDMAEASRECGDLEDEAARVKKQFSNKIEEQKARLQKNADLIRDKFEYRDVKCKKVSNFTTGRIMIQRLDTMEVTEDRLMSMTESQLPLALKDKPKVEDKTAMEVVTEAAVNAAQVEVTPEQIEQAIALVKSSGRATITIIQRRMDVSMEVAAAIMLKLEEAKVVGPAKQDGEAREILIPVDDPDLTLNATKDEIDAGLVNNNPDFMMEPPPAPDVV